MPEEILSTRLLQGDENAQMSIRLRRVWAPVMRAVGRNSLPELHDRRGGVWVGCVVD